MLLFSDCRNDACAGKKKKKPASKASFLNAQGLCCGFDFSRSLSFAVRLNSCESTSISQESTFRKVHFWRRPRAAVLASGGT